MNASGNCIIYKYSQVFYDEFSNKLALKQIGSNEIIEIILIPTEVWNVNSFDQWGVELGKVLGVKVRKYLSQARSGGMG